MIAPHTVGSEAYAAAHEASRRIAAERLAGAVIGCDIDYVVREIEQAALSASREAR